MDWRALFSTFGLIFLAELGDKTQLTTMTLAAQSKAPWSVFLGSAIALVLTSLLGVVFGEALTRVIPKEYLHTGAGLAFIILGLLLVFRRI